MAITKTTTVSSINIIVLDTADYTQSALSLTLVDTLTDPDDDNFPIVTTRRVNIEQGADVSSYPQFVQDVASTVWTP